ncbi:LysR family transcriptional regulator [Streptosporangium saharense]|uniref:LysR family transcriptional regulator n=1 Tax=Streptosporangium saharense TaxID=1706840 RepID=UPI003440719A
MSDLEVRQLRYFVAVAEDLHFGRAAERLGMAQPPLSRAIRELERQLGVPLLTRTTRQVALTPAGEVLLHDARTALDAVTAAGLRARNAGRSEPELRVALKADYDGGLLPRVLDRYRQEAAALPVRLVLGGRGEQAPALRDGRADVALLPAPFDDHGLDVEPLLTEPRLVALAATDPLAARPCLDLADLADRVLPDGTPADQEDLPPGPRHDRRARRLGTPPDREDLPPLPGGAADDSGVRHRAPVPGHVEGRPRGAVAGPRSRTLDLAQIFNLIELGSIVWFPPVSVVRRHPRPGVAYRPVRDLPPLTLTLAWPQNSRSPAVAAFVRTATAIASAGDTRGMMGG